MDLLRQMEEDNGEEKMIINDQGIPIAKSRYYSTPSVRDRLNDARRVAYKGVRV
jgi:hypothetical protein